MRCPALLLAAIGAAALAPAAVGQGVPYGQHIVATLGTATTTTPLNLVSRAGAVANVNGLTLTSVESVQLDPIDSRIWVGGANGDLEKVNLDASGNVATETLHAVVVSATNRRSVEGITFDDNGNPVVLGNKNVFVYDRNDGTKRTIYSIPGLSTIALARAICRDPAGNLYVGVNDLGKIFFLQRNPDCTYQAPVLLGSIQPASNSASLTGLAFLPAQGANPAQLYWCSYGFSGTAVGTFPLPAGPAVTSGTIDQIAAIDYDVRRGDFTITTRANGGVFAMTKAFATSTIATIPVTSNVLPGIDTNSCRDADTNVAPTCVTLGQRFTLEIGTCAPPGRPAGVFMLSPALFTLGTGLTDNSGRVSFKYPNLLVNPGLPGLFVFVSAYLNASNQVVIGPVKPWPSN